MLYLLVFCFSLVNSHIYNAKIFTDHYINLVDRRFLSFSVDPKDLFSSIGKYSSKECSCMASALTPAFLRVAGPSTDHLTFINNSFAVETQTGWHSKDDSISVTYKQWVKFIKWSNSTGFDLVLALNSDKKTNAGMWDANTGLNVLTAADRLGLAGVFWQLGYECKNQSIEEYLNDLETLKVITETFSRPDWKVVGGDVTPCLHLQSKSDFKDYVTLSNDMMDALLLNGNSTSRELERMSDKDRRKLLRNLAKSQVPLWLTEKTRTKTELHRAAEWLASLGFAARNGFSIHYRDLLEEELLEPTLSFYMALLFKNLVGERVLDIEMDVSNATLFAHCTSLDNKPISGAVTLYGSNMDDEPARFSIKLPKKEEGGDIMQFILSLDENDNIVVNSHAMYYEGDIRPVVKHVRPYKSLLISLPPKSFGFWVIANIQVEACREPTKENIENSPEVILSEEEPLIRRIKRSAIPKSKSNDIKVLDLVKSHLEQNTNPLMDRILGINHDLKKIHTIFQAKLNNNALNRLRRESYNSHEHIYKRRESKLKRISQNLPFSSNLIRKILDVTDDLTRPKDIRKKSNKNSIISKINKRRRYTEPREMQTKKKGYGKKTYYSESVASDNGLENKNNNLNKDLQLQRLDVSEDISRKRRSIAGNNLSKHDAADSLENAIELDSMENRKYSKILKKVKKLSHLPLDLDLKNDDYEETDNLNTIVLETKVEDDGAVIKISENPNSKIISSTLEDIISLFSNINKKLRRVWDLTTFLE